VKIIVTFLNGTQYWTDLIKLNAQRASEVLSDPAFITHVRCGPRFDYCAHTPEEVASVIASAGEVVVNVGFYSKWWSKAIAYEQDGVVYFNTRKEAYGAGSPGNIAHEFTHKLGFVHCGNSSRGNANTVPYRIGNEVDLWGTVTSGIMAQGSDNAGAIRNVT